MFEFVFVRHEEKLTLGAAAQLATGILPADL